MAHDQNQPIRLRKSKLGNFELGFIAQSARRVANTLELSLPQRVLLRDGVIVQMGRCMCATFQLDIEQLLEPELFSDEVNQPKEQPAISGWAHV